MKFIIKNKKKSFRISSSLMGKINIRKKYKCIRYIIFSNLAFYDNQFIINCCINNKNKIPLSISDLHLKIRKYKIKFFNY